MKKNESENKNAQAEQNTALTDLEPVREVKAGDHTTGGGTLSNGVQDDDAANRHVRHRGFAIVDRTN